MIRKIGIAKDSKGAAAVEMALAIPILLELLWMVFQAGLVFRAMSGIQHGLGEGARYATLFPQPSNTQIRTKIADAVYGIGPGSFTIASPSGRNRGRGQLCRSSGELFAGHQPTVPAGADDHRQPLEAGLGFVLSSA